MKSFKVLLPHRLLIRTDVISGHREIGPARGRRKLPWKGTSPPLPRSPEIEPASFQSRGTADELIQVVDSFLSQNVPGDLRRDVWLSISEAPPQRPRHLTAFAITEAGNLVPLRQAEV